MLKIKTPSRGRGFNMVIHKNPNPFLGLKFRNNMFRFVISLNEVINKI